MAGLEQIIAEFGQGLSRVASAYEADVALQEDLLQDILIAVHRALPTLNDASRRAAFVFRIAHNRAVTHVMRQAARRARSAEVLAPQDPPATPEQLALAGERSRRLAQAVRRLPLPYRQVITLVLEELTYAEIADALGLSLSNVGVRVNRAKAMLKEMLDDR